MPGQMSWELSARSRKQHQVSVCIITESPVKSICNVAHLLVQPQQKTQLNCKTNITQNHQKIELYGSLKTKEIKEQFIQTGRRGGDAETCRKALRCMEKHSRQMRSPTSTCDGQKLRGIPREQGSQITPEHPAQPSSTRKISPHPVTSGCKNQWGFGWQKKLWDSQESPLKGLATDLGFTQIQHEGKSWKGNSGIWESEVSGIKVSARRELPPGQNSRQQHCLLSELLPHTLHRATEQQHGLPALAIT